MTRAHDHARGSHPRHDADLVMARAEEFCSEHGVPFTPMRRRVLEELASSAVPLTAYDLVERVGRMKRVAPTQIYRALDFLLEAGVIHRLATKSAYVACGHEHGPNETVVFLVCAECGAVEEATSRSVGRGLKGAAAAHGFKPREPVVEVGGECATCQHH